MLIRTGPKSTPKHFPTIVANLPCNLYIIKSISLIAVFTGLLFNISYTSSVYAQTQSGNATSGSVTSGPYTFNCNAPNSCSLNPKTGNATSGSVNGSTNNEPPTTQSQTSHQNFTFPPTGRMIQYDLPLIPTECPGQPNSVSYCFNTPDGTTVAKFWGMLYPSPDAIQSVRILSYLSGGRLIDERGVISPSGTLYAQYIYESPDGNIFGGVSIVEGNSLYVIEFPIFMLQYHREQISTMFRSLVHDPRIS